MTEIFTSRFRTIQKFLATQRLPDSELWERIKHSYYWRSTSQSGSMPYLSFWLVVIIVLIGLLVIWRFRLMKLHRTLPIYDWLINQLANLIVFIIIIAASYTFFRTQEIEYLSSPLVILLSVVIALAWLTWIVYYYWRIIPRNRQLHIEKQRFLRYLPKKKNKK